MKAWLDAPAGKHGFVQMKGDDLQFQNGKPVKFWGVNIASNRPFVEREEAIRWTDFMAAYGINAVRFHKFTWDATDGIHSRN
jgi:beta-galactosidase/beta-glucuronidase